MMEIGIDKGIGDYQGIGDYPYVIAEVLDCESINDVGTESYCIVDEDKEKQLVYSKTKNNRGNKSSKPIRVKKGSERYQDEVYPYWNGYRNGRGDLTEEQFALLYLDVELYE